MEKELPVKWKIIEPNVWKPENVDDFVEGILVGRKEDVGDNESKAYDLDTKEGIKMVWGSTVLDDRMRYVDVGSRIRITYKGTTKNRKNQDLKIFQVAVAEPEEKTELKNQIK